MNKRTRIIILLACISLIVLGVAVLMRRSTLPDPRPLVPIHADLYIELASLEQLGPAIERLSSEAGVPLSLPYLAHVLSPDLLRPMKFPGSTGFDATRPLGIVASFPPGSLPLVVGFFPVRDRSALTEELGLPSGSLGLRAVAIKGMYVAYERGYLLVSLDARTIEDLFVLREKGVDLPARDPGTLATAYALPHLLYLARSLLSYAPEDASAAGRIPPLLLGKALDVIRSIRMEVRDDAGLSVTTHIELPGDNPLLKALSPAGGHPPLLDLLPAAAFIGGLRVEPGPAQRLKEEELEILRPLVTDSATLHAIRARVQHVSGEYAGAVLRWDHFSADASNAVWMEAIPPGREEEFDAHTERVHHAATGLWQTLLQDSGDSRITMNGEDLAPETYRGVVVNGVRIRTKLPIEPPLFADANFRRHLGKLTNRASTYRYGRVTVPPDSRAFMITTTGLDPSVMKSQIDLLLAPRDSPSRMERRAANDTAILRAVRALPQDVAGYCLIDPFLLAGRDSTAAHYFGLSVRGVEAGIEIDLVLPREHLRGIALKFLSHTGPRPAAPKI